MKKYAITGFACLAVAALYCGLRDFHQMELAEKYRTLCDGFTVPGVLCLCLGALLWAGKKGAFSGIGYCLCVAGNALLPGHREPETYYDYVHRHQKNRKADCGFLFACGGICLAIALLFVD